MSKSPRKMWEKGVPLRDAFVDFYGFPNHENDKEAKQTRFNFLVLGEKAEPGEYDAYNPETYRYSPKEKPYRLKLQNDFRNIICISFAKHLKARNLIAIGFWINFEGNRECVEITPEQIEIPKIDNSEEFTEADIRNGGIRKLCESWDSDIFYGITEKYEEVRIYDPRYNLDGTPNKKYFPEKVSQSEKYYSDKVGKPSKRIGVIEVFEKLKNKNKIDFLRPQIEAARVVQKYIETEMPDFWDDGKYLDAKTIANHIREAFNTEKVQAKAREGK